MRFALALLAVLAAGSVPGTAQADPYRWCAEYGGSNGGRNCGFVTWEQCRAAISGDNSAFCVPNAHYDGRGERPVRR